MLTGTESSKLEWATSTLIPLAAELRVAPSKLSPPRLPSDYVRRAALTAHLRSGLDRALTLVCAPAGFGKTTLVSAALAENHRPVAWLALDPEDSPLPTFLQALIASIRLVFPDACRTTLTFLQLAAFPPPATLTRALQLDLSELPEELVIALDDYHLLDSAEVDALLLTLLRHEVPGIHLVLMSRRVPSWPLGRLRAAEALLELGPKELRFTAEEAQAFLVKAHGGAADGPASAALRARLDGWAAGLRLAVVAFRAGVMPAAGPALDGRAEQYIAAYLLEEIVAQQPVDVQQFLQRTALAERFCPALGDALMEWSDPLINGERVLAHLEQLGLFVIALGDRHGWYRYHDLFRDALREQLRVEQPASVIAALHRTASAWFAREGHTTEALQHALAGNDAAGAAALVEAAAPLALDRGEWQQLEEWLRRLPPALIQERPALLVAQGWVGYFRAGIETFPPLAAQAEALLEQNALGLAADRIAALRAEIDGLWAIVWYTRGDPERAARCAEHAWTALPATATFALSHSGAILNYAWQWLGDSIAVDRLMASERASSLARQPSSICRLRYSLVDVHRGNGDLGAAAHAAWQVVRLADTQAPEPLVAWAHYSLGSFYYVWNDLAAAEQHFRAVLERRHQANVYVLFGSLQWLALINLAQGRAPTDSELVQGFLELTQGAWALDQETANAFAVHLALLQGQGDLPRRWLRQTRSPMRYRWPIGAEVPELTRLRALLAVGTAETVAEATRYVSDLLEMLARRHDTPRTIEALALQALAHDARGAGKEARTVLEQAVRLAAPGGWVRTFVDLGQPAARLLRTLAPRSDTREFVGRLLAAFANASLAAVPVPDGDSAREELIEPLSGREREVLALLASRLRNKEIAAALYISWHTVTRHTVNIYQKLQVTNRRDAVERGRALGLIPRGEAGVEPLAFRARDVPDDSRLDGRS